jgi:hypothetical protein
MINWTDLQKQIALGEKTLKDAEIARLEKLEKERALIQEYYKAALAAIPNKVRISIINNRENITVFGYSTNGGGDLILYKQVQALLEDYLNKLNIRTSTGCGEDGYGSGYELYANVSDLKRACETTFSSKQV